MNNRENTFKKYLVRTMGTRWDVQSHEDSYSENIPDLSFGLCNINGWIELKQIEKWPARKETLLKPSKYTSGQVNWLNKRNKKGGHCFVMMKVGSDDYFLFRASFARKIKNGMTDKELKDYCIAHWEGSVDPDELVKYLSGSTN